MSRFVKILFIFLGTISLVLGVIGIFIPGLPTTPFLLLTAALYVRSSEFLYNKLISNNFLSGYIRNYSEKKGISLRIKIYSISIMWLMITLSTLFLIDLYWVDILVIFIGFIGTIVMGFVLKTVH